MHAFPAFFPLAGATVVIAGDGEPAAARQRLFADAPARIVRLEGDSALVPEAYAGAALVFIASLDPTFSRAAEAAARRCGAPVNVFDDPVRSDFHTPAIVDRGTLVVAIGTGGAAPMLATALRAELEERLGPELGETARVLGARRAAIKAAFPDLVDRRAFLRRQLARPGLTVERLDADLAGPETTAGRIFLIETPDTPDLLSLRAARALAVADVIAGPMLAFIDHHGRREAPRLTHWAYEDLRARVRAGEIVALIDPPADAEAALAGADCTRLRAAPEAG
jgi:precorrin-2 dehydrogenase/sirohydrochlorin ferrochelatase